MLLLAAPPLCVAERVAEDGGQVAVTVVKPVSRRTAISDVVVHDALCGVVVCEHIRRLTAVGAGGGIVCLNDGVGGGVDTVEARGAIVKVS